jgi:hypothetical protein
MRVIKSGISADDEVIISGLQRAKPGAKVRVTKSNRDTAPSSESKE